MSEGSFASNIKSSLVNSIEDQKPSLKNVLTRRVIAAFGKQEKSASPKLVKPQEAQGELAKMFLTVSISSLSKDYKLPHRLQIGSEVFWTDSQGSKVDKYNIDRFEKMLANGDFDNRDTLTGLELELYEDTIGYWIRTAKVPSPIKINNSWWDVQGNKSDPINAARFEAEYN